VATVSFAAKAGTTPPPITTLYTPIPGSKMRFCKSVLADMKHHG